jgi:hypothetical protein
VTTEDLPLKPTTPTQPAKDDDAGSKRGKRERE